MNYWDFVNMKSFCTAKDTINETKNNLWNGRRYLQKVVWWQNCMHSFRGEAVSFAFFRFSSPPAFYFFPFIFKASNDSFSSHVIMSLVPSDWESFDQTGPTWVNQDSLHFRRDYFKHILITSTKFFCLSFNIFTGSGDQYRHLWEALFCLPYCIMLYQYTTFYLSVS